MKNKIIIFAVSVIVVLAIGAVWWNIPVHFLNGVAAENVACIKVADGYTGKQFDIEEKEDIDYIVTNIQSADMKKTKLSVRYMGYRFRLVFYDKNKNVIDEFIVNSNDRIRKDPFFYSDKTGGLCVEYLQNLNEEKKAD